MTIKIPSPLVESPPPPLAHPDDAQDIRESMRGLPTIVQPLLTWLTGKPLKGQTPWTLTPLHHLMSGILAWVAGIVLGVIALSGQGIQLPWLLPSWMLTIHGTRKLRLMILHQTSHTNLFGAGLKWQGKRVDELIGETLTILLLNGSFEEYKRSHLEDHHPVISHMTMEDPTVKALIVHMGLRAGMSKRALWQKLWWTLLSPRFHITFFLSRLTSHFRSATPTQRWLTTGYMAAMVGIVAVTNTWLLFGLTYVFPLTIPYHISTALRLCTKHVFPKPGEKASLDTQKQVLTTQKGVLEPTTYRRLSEEYNEAVRRHIAGLTHGIFVGERTPSPTLPFLQKGAAWIGWAGKMIFVHFPARFLVLVGDSLCHDYHHRYQNAPQWANYIFARAEDAVEHRKWPPYTEVWTLAGAIDAVFDSLSQADPHEYTPGDGHVPSLGDLFLEIDE